MVSYNTILLIIIVINCICQFICLNNYIIKHKIHKLFKYKNKNNNFNLHNITYNCNYINYSSVDMEYDDHNDNEFFLNDYYLLRNIF